MIEKPEKDIVMTGWIAGEGIRILAEKYEKELAERLPHSIINRAKNMGEKAELPEAGYVVYEAGDGGIFVGLWNMAEAMDKGIVIDLSGINVRQETIEICEFFDINPYMLCTKGTFLIVADNGNHVVRQLAEKGCFAEVIGYTHSGGDRVIINDGEIRYLESRITDELQKFI